MNMTVKASRANQKTIFLFTFTFIYIISTESREQYSKGARGTCGVEADCALQSPPSRVLSSALQSDGHCFAPRRAAPFPFDSIELFVLVLMFSAQYCIHLRCPCHLEVYSTAVFLVGRTTRRETTRRDNVLADNGTRDSRGGGGHIHKNGVVSGSSR